MKMMMKMKRKRGMAASRSVVGRCAASGWSAPLAHPPSSLVPSAASTDAAP
jgi:hypothetical protein